MEKERKGHHEDRSMAHLSSFTSPCMSGKKNVQGIKTLILISSWK